MERKRTLTMNWDALGDYDDDDDRFFDTSNRLSSFAPLDLASSGSDDDDEFDDPRTSFASAISSISTTEFRNCTTTVTMSPDYDIWMGAPGSISERRKRLFQGFGFNREASIKELNRAASKITANGNSNGNGYVGSPDGNSKQETWVSPSPAPSPSPLPLVLVRSRSDSDIEAFSVDKKRKEDFLGPASKQSLARTSSMINLSHARLSPSQDSVSASVLASPKDAGNPRSVKHQSGQLTSTMSNNRLGAFFVIKNLDTGKEFIVNEHDQDGTWNRLSDLQTGKKLTMEEFEKDVGHSPVVKELMRRENSSRMNGEGRKIAATNSYFFKSLRMSKRRGAALLKNIKGVAHSMSMSGSRNEKENNNNNNNNNNNHPAAHIQESTKQQGKNSSCTQSGWVKVRQTGKSYKEMSALHLCQEIQAHEGSIWAMKFSWDARFLASGGEDKVIRVWEVQECEVMSLHDGNLTQLQLHHPSSTPSLGEMAPLPSERKKKKKGKGNPIPEYVHVPETVFSLSEKPVCSFTGHRDDILDLSWSKSQLLLSSSMDKTVRLWDMESKTCLKVFAHNDYVTCIQFNPTDDDYFISGSLDAKVRIWNIPDRQLVDWTDLHEMVTAVSYTPDGQGAIIGSYKGSCRMYSVEDCKLTQLEQVTVQRKRSHPKKITGFQFSPVNPSEVVVTSADSRVRILDGAEVFQKFKGFRNMNSQISASFSLDGKHVICASEDSHVYMWKREEPRTTSGKGKNVINVSSYETFQCKDVSVAIFWPATAKGDPPPVQVKSKRQSKRSTTSQSSSACGSPTKEDTSTSSKRHSQPNELSTREENSLASSSMRQLRTREDAAADSKRQFQANQSPTREENSLASNSKRLLQTKEDDATANSKRHFSPSASPTREENSQATNSKRQLPPLPKKNNNIERLPTPPEDDLSLISRSDSGIGESFTSNSSSWSWSEGRSDGNHTGQATAWGLVIVTATLGGEIKAYQNFGLPRRIGRQANLF